MSNQLHILNGDGTAGGFHQSGITGEVAIWREILCEGPVGRLSSSDFFENRAAFLNSPNEATSYEELMSSEWKKIEEFHQYDEVTLWFEHDLFCQLNLVALLSWFADQDIGNTRLSLVCIHEHEHHIPFYGIGQLMPEEFPPLFEKRSLISSEMLSFAKQVWDAYCAAKPLPLQELIQEADFKYFPYLKHALSLHLLRFPHHATGLNALEKRILDVIHEHQELTYKALMRTLLTGENQFWGFGDLQYAEFINTLSSLIDHTDVYRLNEIGKAVRVGEKSFKSYRSTDALLGGSSIHDWVWYEDQLIQVA